jgi:anti-sigma factor RsiW
MLKIMFHPQIWDFLRTRSRNTWRSEESEKSKGFWFKGLVAPLKCLVPLAVVRSINRAVLAKAGAKVNTGAAGASVAAVAAVAVAAAAAVAAACKVWTSA